MCFLSLYSQLENISSLPLCETCLWAEPGDQVLCCKKKLQKRTSSCSSKSGHFHLNLLSMQVELKGDLMSGGWNGISVNLLFVRDVGFSVASLD